MRLVGPGVRHPVLRIALGLEQPLVRHLCVHRDGERNQEEDGRPHGQTPNPEPRIPNPESRIPSPESRIPNPGLCGHSAPPSLDRYATRSSISPPASRLA